MNNLIAVTIGDINGIGIEILIKLWKKKKIRNFILISNVKIFDNYLKQKKIKLKYKKIDNFDMFKNYNNKLFSIFNISAKNTNENTYNSLKTSYYLNKNNICNAIITLPLNKAKLSVNLKKKFIGHTEFFQKEDKKVNSNMIFYSKEIIVTSLTTHIQLKDVHKIFKNRNFIYNKIMDLNETLIKDFNINNPRIVLSGLNPHSGENGKIGKEEIKFFKPQVNKLLKNKINISGPYSADMLFSTKNIKKFDCFICAYHDQALIPFKIISKFKGTNYTGSLNIIRLSPTHGTAYDIVGKNMANDESILYSFKVANEIIKNRKNFEKTKKITRSKLSN